MYLSISHKPFFHDLQMVIFLSFSLNLQRVQFYKGPWFPVDPRYSRSVYNVEFLVTWILVGYFSMCNSWILVNFVPCWTSCQFWLACMKRECQDSQEIEVLCPLKQKISVSLQSEIKGKVRKGMFQSFHLRLERILSKLTKTPKTLQFSFERVQATPQQCMKPCVWLGIYMEGKQEIRRDNRFSSNE